MTKILSIKFLRGFLLLKLKLFHCFRQSFYVFLYTLALSSLLKAKVKVKARVIFLVRASLGLPSTRIFWIFISIFFSVFFLLCMSFVSSGIPLYESSAYKAERRTGYVPASIQAGILPLQEMKLAGEEKVFYAMLRKQKEPSLAAEATLINSYRSSSAKLSAAASYYSKGDYASAHQLYKELVADHPSSASAILHFNLANSYARLYRNSLQQDRLQQDSIQQESLLARAILEYEKVLAINPGYLKARQNLAFMKGDIFLIEEKSKTIKQALNTGLWQRYLLHAHGIFVVLLSLCVAVLIFRGGRLWNAPVNSGLAETEENEEKSSILYSAATKPWKLRLATMSIAFFSVITLMAFFLLGYLDSKTKAEAPALAIVNNSKASLQDALGPLAVKVLPLALGERLVIQKQKGQWLQVSFLKSENKNAKQYVTGWLPLKDVYLLK